MGSVQAGDIRHGGTLNRYLDNGYCTVLQEWVRLSFTQQCAIALQQAVYAVLYVVCW
jgi:hypothetical protein